jgi:hypothetical protein
MEVRNSGAVYRLFVIIIFLFISILFVNNQKKMNPLATNLDISSGTVIPLSGLHSADQVYHYVSSFVPLHNIDLLINVLHQSAEYGFSDLVEKLVTDQSCFLSDEEKIRIILGCVAHSSNKKTDQYVLLDTFLKYPALFDSSAVLLTLMRSNYHEVLPIFLSWVRERQKKEKYHDLWELFIEKSLFLAVEQNDYATVKSMLSKKIRISEKKASLLLWHAVACNKNIHFIPLLVRRAQADINYAYKGKTLLIEAVAQNNKEMIQMLLDEGAIVDRIVDSSIGSALHVASLNNNYIIQELLKEYGA